EIDLLVGHEAAVVGHHLVGGAGLVDDDGHDLDATDAALAVQLLDPELGGGLGRQPERPRRRAREERDDADRHLRRSAGGRCGGATRRTGDNSEQDRTLYEPTRQRPSSHMPSPFACTGSHAPPRARPPGPRSPARRPGRLGPPIVADLIAAPRGLASGYEGRAGNLR